VFNVTVIPEVSPPSPINISSGTEPVCSPTNNTTTTYSTTATNNMGFHWSINNSAAGIIDSATGVMTWTIGFSGTVTIQVYAYGCSAPSPTITRIVTVNNCGSGYVINGKTRYTGKANVGSPVPNPPTYNSVIYDIDHVIVILKNYPSGTEIARDTSDAAGAYLFSNISNGTYKLSYDKYTPDTMQTGSDVNAIDVALIKYYIGSDTTVDPSRCFSSKYKKAANVDNNSTINAIDVARIKAKVGSPYDPAKNFPRGNWVAFDTVVTVSNSNLNITLKTICYGDYNAASTKYRDSTTTWSLAKSLPENIVVNSEDYTTISDPSYFEVPLLISTKVKDFSALGLELKYPDKDFRLVGVSMPGIENQNAPLKINPSFNEILADNNDLLVTDEDGIIRVVFATTKHFDVTANEELIRFGFQAKPGSGRNLSDFSLEGPGVIGNMYGEESDDAYLIMPKVLFQGNQNDAGFEFTAYPNPFNDQTTLCYDLPENGDVKINIYNAIGERVSELLNEPQTSGKHTVIFRSKNLPAGIYTLRFDYLGPDKSKCMVLKLAH